MIKKFRNRINYLLNILGDFKKSFYVVFCITGISSLLEIIGLASLVPLIEEIMKKESDSIIRRFFRVFIDAIPFSPLISIALIFLTIMALRSFFLILRAKYSAKLVYSFRDAWRVKIFRKYINTKLSYLISKKQGVITHNALIEPENASSMLNNLIQFLIQLISFLSIYVLLLTAAFWMTLVLSVSMGGILFIVAFFGNKAMKKYGEQRIKYGQNLNTKCIEATSGLRQVKLFGFQEREISDFEKNSKLDSLLLEKYAMFKDLPSALNFLVIGMIFFGMILYFTFSQANISDFVPILGLFALTSSRLAGTASGIVSSRMILSSLLPSVKLLKFLENDIELEDLDRGTDFNKLDKDIEFKDVSFSYGSKKIFEKVNITFKKGKMTALIGPSGIGKSTIADLISGFYFPTSGDIFINNKSIQEYKIASLRKKISYISQEPFIFNCSVKENILLGNPNASETDLINAAKIAHCHEFISEMPEGYDSIVGDKGSKLSGGQKQRISIARGIIRNPEIYIFDEATSSLDNASEKFIQSSIERISENTTVIIIAHRLSTIENADVIIDLSKI